VPPALAGVLADPLWRAPLVPVALAATLGVAVDRYVGVPLPVSLLLAAAALVAWAVALFGRRSGLAAVYLWLTAAALAAGYHRSHTDWYAANDIGHAATSEPRPAQLRGVLEEEPAVREQPPPDAFHNLPRGVTTTSVLAVAEMRGSESWLPVSGRARLLVEGAMPDLHAGDEVEVIGRLSSPMPPGNPGEPDHAGHLRDQRIRAVLLVRKTADGVSRLREGWSSSLRGWLAALRGHCRRVLEEAIPEKQEQGLAVALLLGDGTALPESEWDRYFHSPPPWSDLTAERKPLEITGVLGVFAFLLPQGSANREPLKWAEMGSVWSQVGHKFPSRSQSLRFKAAAAETGAVASCCVD
jgi:competence protein ComEC